MSHNIPESELYKHVQAFASHIYFDSHDRLSNRQALMWTNMSRLGVGVVTDVSEGDERCFASIVMTDSFGHTVGSDVYGDRKLFLVGDKVVGFQLCNESTGKFFTFIVLAKR